MGCSKARLGADMDEFRAILRHHRSDFLEDPTFVTDDGSWYWARLVVSDPKDVASWIRDADTISARFEVQSCGRSLEIVKDIGAARVVAKKHGVVEMLGTHGLGHARLATESSVLPNASHPFWARPFPDVAIVHNGQITDYYLWRDRLVRKGYRFLTENDSELIAVWVADQMSNGRTLLQALHASISALDGVFTYMIADCDGIGYAKDRLAIKPLVVADRGGQIAAATEEQAIWSVIDGEGDVTNLDGPSMFGVWGRGNRRLAA
jgi:glutamate synthase domain-containing protein 1